MMLPWDVSIRRRNYFALVAFLQLIIVDNSGAAMAQNFNNQNIQEQVKERQAPQNTTIDFNVGRSNQPRAARAEYSHRTAHRKHKKQ